MRTRSKALALISAGLLALTCSGTAHAADGKQLATDPSGPSGPHGWKCTDIGTTYAEACFAGEGEWFKIRDTNADNYPVVILWEFYDSDTGQSRSGQIWNTAGKDAGWRYLNKSFTENNAVAFRACAGNYNNNTYFPSTCTMETIEDT